MRIARPLLILLVVVAGAIALAACGGGDDGRSIPGPTPDTAFFPNVPEQVPDDQNRFARQSSVGDGISSDIPEFAPQVRAAARKAGCMLRGFPSSGRSHLPRDSDFAFTTNPPTSGNHYDRWADWGIYDKPIPYPVQVHNLEHGGILVHVGTNVPKAAREALGRLWAESPPFVMLMPDDSESFPQNGLVITSWQRWMVCKPYQAEDLEAIKVFRDVYRGTGPEGVAGLNTGVSNDYPGMPAPLVPDVGAIPGNG